MISRRPLLGAALAAPALLLGHRARAAETVRFSEQSSSTLLLVAKSQGLLEKRLAPMGLGVQWAHFNQVVEPMSAGSVDFHGDVADAVPIFAQAGGADVTYYAMEAPSPHAQAIIVQDESPVRSMADLKGKRVAVRRGAGAHYLLVAALARAGLTAKDIVFAYMAPNDAGIAFMQGQVDAWAIWDPFLAIAQRRGKVRVLADGSDGLSSYRRFYMAQTPFLKAHDTVVTAVFEVLAETGQWIGAHPQEAAKLLAPLWGNLDPAVVEIVNSRRSNHLVPVTSAIYPEQQRIADVFAAEKLIPGKLDVAAVPVWIKGR